MVYGYIRVSTGHQNTENQKMEIERFCKQKSLKVDYWIEEKISGTKSPEKRKLGKILMNSSRKGDIVVLAGFGAGLTWASCIMRWAKEDL